MTQPVPHNRPGKPCEGEEVMHGQRQVERTECHVGRMKGHIFKQEEACSSQHVEPGPVLLPKNLIRVDGRILHERPKPCHRALDAKHSPRCSQIPEDLEAKINIVMLGNDPDTNMSQCHIKGTVYTKIEIC